MLRRRLVEGRVRALWLRERLFVCWDAWDKKRDDETWEMRRTDNNRRSLCDFTDFFIFLHNLLDARLYVCLYAYQLARGEFNT